jgi:hypothetical protein
MTISDMSKARLGRFEAKVDRDGGTEPEHVHGIGRCWIWRGLNLAADTTREPSLTPDGPITFEPNPRAIPSWIRDAWECALPEADTVFYTEKKT